MKVLAVLIAVFALATPQATLMNEIARAMHTRTHHAPASPFRHVCAEAHVRCG